MGQLEPTGGGRKRLFVALAVGLAGLLVLGLLAMGNVFLIPRLLAGSAPSPTVRVARTPTRAIALATIAPTATSELTEAPTPTLVNASGEVTPPSSATVLVRTETPGVAVSATRTSPPTLRPRTPTVEVVGTPASGQLPQSGGGEDFATSAHMRFDYPASTSVDKRELVTVQIKANALVAMVGYVSSQDFKIFDDKRTQAAGWYKTIDEEIRAFPFVHASLQSSDFEVHLSEASPWQPLTRDKPAAWSWELIPKTPGPKSITLDIYGKDDLTDEFWFAIRGETVDIVVLDKPLPERIQDFVGANLALIGSLLGSGGAISLIVERLIISLKEREDKRKDKKHR